MGTVDLSVSQGLPERSRREGSVRRLRAPWRRGAWSSGEVALALQAQRADLLRAVRARTDTAGVPDDVLEELVNEAICVVVMMRRPIVCEEHLMGAFWTAVRLLLRHYREGRYGLRVGSRPRVEFEAAAVRAAAGDPGPDEVAESKDRVARAADFVAQLSEFERQVVAIMAVRGVGAKLTARALGVPVKSVRAAERSAWSKLDRVAVIAAAGRLCDFRERAIAAYASGSAQGEDERVARAHLTACASCRGSYAQLVREMRSREFRRSAAAAFLPAPVLPLGHHAGWMGRLLGYGVDRAIPAGGPGDRAAEVLGGAGIVKVAAAGGAVVMATATLATGIPKLVAPSQHHKPHPQYGMPTRRTATTLVAPGYPSAFVGAPTQAAPRATAQSSAPTARHPAGTSHLTSREHAALEFGPQGSPPSGTPSHSPQAPIASAASTHTSSTSSVSGAERSGSPTGEGESRVDNGSANRAAREFAQP
jgi:DNA-directed RNA polymerase specialized sigma24 family protein